MQNLSIIIPTHGSPQFLKEALLSVAQQDLENSDYTFEILLGIDNCLDSRKAAIGLKQLINNLKIFFFNEQVGPYIIRNTLAQRCGSDYILFFDSDDIMPPGFLKGVLALLRVNDMILFYHKNFIDVVDNAQTNRITDFKRIELFRKAYAVKYETNIANTSIYDKIKKTINTGNLFRKKFYVNFINRTFHKNLYISGVFAIKTETFLTLNGYKSWPVAADSEFIMRAEVNHISQAYINKAIAFLRRVHAESLTLNHKFGMGSDVRNMYHAKRVKEITNNNTFIAINTNFIEITELI